MNPNIVSSLPLHIDGSALDPRFSMNPFGSLISELEFYKKWFPLAVTLVCILVVLFAFYVMYVAGGIVFIRRHYVFIRKRLVQGKGVDEIISIVHQNSAPKPESKPNNEIYAIVQNEKNLADKPKEASF